jgi:hypothetical protein
MAEMDVDFGRILSRSEKKILIESDNKTLQKVAEEFKLDWKLFRNRFDFIKSMDLDTFSLFIMKLKEIYAKRCNLSAYNFIPKEREFLPSPEDISKFKARLELDQSTTNLEYSRSYNRYDDYNYFGYNTDSDWQESDTEKFS